MNDKIASSTVSDNDSTVLSGRINRDIPVPLYYQISQLIRVQIRGGQLKPGDQIPTEDQLQKRFNVSRATIRRAISELVYEGLLERRRARGTVVSKAKLEETLYGLASFTNEILKRGMIPKSKILSFDVTPASSAIAEYLQIATGDNVLALERLRIVNGEPVGIEKWYAPLQHLPGVDRSFFKEEGIEQSTYYMLQERFGIKLVKAVDTMTALALEERDAKLLKMEKGMPALQRTRISYDDRNVPIVYASGLYIIKLIITLETVKSLFDQNNW